MISQIRGEFMRASRILAGRPDRAVLALAELCEERKDEYLASPPPFVPPRLSPLPPQTPYTVGSSPMRPKGVPVPGRPSSPTQASESGPHKLAVQRVSTHAPPEHMAPKRGKWTSPPLPEASSADHTYFEDQLGIGLELATASTEAREREATYNSSSSNSEVFSDDEHPSDLAESDDATSVRSFTEGFTSSPLPFRRPSRLNPHNSSSRTLPSCSSPADPIVRSNSGGRGRLSSREKSNEIPPEISSRQLTNLLSLPSRTEVSRRSLSGPPRSLNGHSWSSNTPVALATPLPPSPDHSKVPHNMELSTVFYQTTTRSPRPTALYPNVGLQSPLFPQYPSHQYHIPPTGTTSQDTSPLEQPLVNPRSSILTEGRSSAGPDTPTPGSYSRSTHSHSHSASTVTQGITPTLSNSSQPAVISSSLTAPSPPPSSSPTMSPGHRFDTQINGSTLLHASISEEGSSSTPSSTGYTTSLSRSPSPSLPPTATLVPTNRKTDLQKRTVRYPLQSKY